MIKYLGYACINMNLSDSTITESSELVKVSNKNKILTSRTIRMSGFTLQKASQLSLQNVQDLYKIVQWNIKHNIFLFRISSEIFPFIDHPDLTYDIQSLPDAGEIIQNLNAVGKLANQHNVRLTAHPGPYTCIASPNDNVVTKSLLSIRKHVEVANMLDTKDFVINIHIGGNYNKDYEKTAQNFCRGFKQLSSLAQSFITVENDDKPNMWSVKHLYDYIYKEIGVPIVFDIHHWKFNSNNMSMEDSARLALSTWSNKFPKMHYSESRADARPQAHSDYIINKIPEFDGNYDVMIEAKQKDKTLLKYLQEHA